MIKKSILYASVCAAVAVAMPLSPALADAPVGFAGTLTGMYGNSFLKGAGTDSSLDSYGISGSGAYGFDIPNFAAEIDGSYGHIGTHGNDADTWSIGGSIFWASAIGRVGGTGSYSRVELLGSGSGDQLDTSTYGAFGEYYLNDMITFGVKGGWFHATAGFSGCGGEGSSCGSSATGNYFGGAATWYAIPDVALWTAVDYLTFDSGNFTTYSLGGEYLFSEMLPISGFASWSNTQISSGGGHENTFLFGFKYYFNNNGSTLKDRQRNGTLGWLASPIQILR